MVDPCRVRVSGPLAPYAAGFIAELAAQGYTPRSVRDWVYVLARVSRWLDEQRLEAAGLTPEVAERFLQARHRDGRTMEPSARGLGPLLGYLRRLDVAPVPAAPADTPVEQVLETYRAYLVTERGLAAGTVRSYADVARAFLSQRRSRDGLGLDRLQAGDVTAYVLRESRQRSVGSMKALVTALRSLLRFCFVAGLVPGELAPAVPAVASWQGSSLPRALEAGQVRALLDSCDRTTAVGRRDFAILTLLVRLGLRIGEVAALLLDDVDWRAGELVIRGKAGHLERLPLPHDVGEALADYLCHGRPRCRCRTLFIRACAPQVGMRAHAVGALVRSAGTRAGLAGVGAHRLRHTAATEMLRRGATLSQVAQVLRHRSEATTAIYAKVDRAALSLVAQPWPGTQG